MKARVVLVFAMTFLAGCASNETDDKEKRGPANEETRFVTQVVTVEETTVSRETTEVTTGFEFSVGRSPMDEDEDDDKVVRRREVVVDGGDKSSSATQEKQYPPESDSSDVECRFFSQSEWVQADAKQRAFIQGCDRAAGRMAPSVSPSENERDAKGSSQERATQPEPQSPPPTPPEPQPMASPSGGDVDCPDLAPGEAQSYLLPGDPYGLDKDNDSLACE